MKPKTLKIEGLNSFQKQQTVEFDRLMERGIFGIFGATGSGKSTILDAIILCLYGNIPRNSKNFINSNGDTCKLSFEFELNQNTYVVERVYKSKKDGGCSCRVARMYRKNKDSQIDILAEGSNAVTDKSEQIIGLKYNDFIRTVVLPQGKFSEFLTLKPSDRNNMLERILHLEQYGISLENKIKKYKMNTEIELKQIESKMSVYGDLNNENLEKLQLEYKSVLENIQNLKSKKSEIQKRYEEAERVWKLQIELQRYENLLNEILKSEKEIKSYKNKLELSKKADIIYPHVKAFETTQNELNETKKELDLKSYEFKSISENFDNKKQQYIKAKDIKDSQYDILLKKKADLENALNMLQQMKSISKLRQSLETQYSDCYTDYKKVLNEFEKLKTIKAKYNSNLKDILEIKEKLKVNTDYKQNIEKACELEKSYRDLSLKIKDLDKKKISLEKSVANSQTLNSKLETDLKNLDVDIKNLEDKLKILNQNDSQTEVLKLQDKYNQICLDYNLAKEIEIKIDNIVAELESLNLDKKNQQLELNRKDFVEIKSEIEQLKKNLDSINISNLCFEIIETLEDGSICPVCGSVFHSNSIERIDDSEIVNLKSKLQDCQNKKESIQRNIDRLETEIEINEIQYKKLNSELKTISKNRMNLELLKSEKENLKSKLENLKHNIEDWKAQKEDTEISLKQKIEQKNKLNIENARIVERLKKDEQNCGEIIEQLRIYCEQSNKLKLDLQEYVSITKIEDFHSEKQILDEKEKKLSKIEIEEKKLRKNLEQNLDAIEELTATMGSLKDKITQISASINQKLETEKEYNKNISKLCENRDIHNYMSDIDCKIAEILNNEKKLYLDLNDMDAEKQKLANLCAGLNTQYKTLDNIHLSQKQELYRIVELNGFQTVNDIKDSILSDDIKFKISNDIDKYDQNYKSISDNLKRLRLELNGKTLNKEEWESIESSVLDISSELDRINQYGAVISEKISVMETNLKQLENLNHIYQNLNHQMGLIEDISKITKGNRFIKFVSRRQMRYITKEATINLKKITKDRYAIEMDDNDDFIMRDDFLGGIRRKPDTLSGGELFLTSLCLALALSSHIQLKNKATLEFFFLDEGFGSLDSELLETVIDSLEKLHSDNMHIGVISHVEELKNRIPAKLIVNSDRENMNGSKIELELT